MQLKNKTSDILVAVFYWACEAECHFNDLLDKIGWRRKSFSQKHQDKWVLEKVFPDKRGGYFVEIGGGDGRTHSNSYVLERDYDWTGIVIEADPKLVPRIRNKRRCICVEACVDDREGEVNFLSNGYLGGIVSDDTDYSHNMRGDYIQRHSHDIITLKTKTLSAILEECNAPKVMEFLSIDVEGAEYRILKNFPFTQYHFRAIVIERPCGKVHELLNKANYVLVKYYRYDGFYLTAELASQLRKGEVDFSKAKQKCF